MPTMASWLTAWIREHPGRRDCVLSGAYITAMAAMLSLAMEGRLVLRLATVRTYLDVQALHMAGRMTYEVHVDRGLEQVAIPSLLVQPLGLAEAPEGGVSADLWIPSISREAVAG